MLLLQPSGTTSRTDPHCPQPRYTSAGRASITCNPYANGWSEEGLQRYGELMTVINESRAFYNSSFDKRMLKFANGMMLREKRKKKKQTALPTVMLPNEMALPSIATILQEQPNAEATSWNLELMEFEDELPEEEQPDSNTAAV